MSNILFKTLSAFQLRKPLPGKLSNCLSALAMTGVLLSCSHNAVADDIDAYINKHTQDVKPNILFILDQSGSMGGTRQRELINALNDIVDSSAYEGFNISVLNYFWQFWQTRITPQFPFTTLNDANRPELKRVINQMYPQLGTPTTPAYFFGANWFTDKWDHDHQRASVEINTSTPIRKNIGTNIFNTPPDGYYEYYQTNPHHPRNDFQAKYYYDKWDTALKYYPDQGQSPISQEKYCAPNSIVLMTDGSPNVGFQTLGTDAKDPRGEARWDQEFTLNTKYESSAFRTTERDCSRNGTSPWTTGFYKNKNPSIGGCILDAARFLANTDLRPDDDFPGIQNITTHTIGFGIGGKNSNTYKFIDDIAKAGNGETFVAENGDDLTQAFRDIFDSSGATVPYSYNSPSLAIDLSNPNNSTEFSYVPLSKPQLTDIWYGNLKKYKYIASTNSSSPSLKDRNKNDALDEKGEFKEDQQDYWAPAKSSDIITNGVAGLLNARTDRTIYTELTNNELVEINKITKPIIATTKNNSIYQHSIAGDALPAQFENAQTVLSWNYDNSDITGQNGLQIKNSILTLTYPDSSSGVPSISHIRVGHDPRSVYKNSWFRGSTLKIYRENETAPAYSKTFNSIGRGLFTIYPTDDNGNFINAKKIEWIAPQNDTYSALSTFKVYINENSDDRAWFTTTKLPADSIISITDNSGGQQNKTISKMGAPLHTKPLEISYPEQEKTLVYLPTSEGVLHAFDAKTGKEEWGFMPSELLGNITTLKNNPYSNSTGTPVYGLDGQPKYYSIKDQFDIEQKILVFGMRRGGNSYYALDITDPYNPKFLWKIQGGVGDFEKLGQTWATPSPTPMKLAGKSVPILVISGGYDASNDIDGDPDNSNNTSDGSNALGNAIYFVNAKTGARLFWISNDTQADLTLQGMKNSIVTDPELVKIDNDEYIDRLYFSDLGGRIIRVDIDNDGTYESDNQFDAISAAIVADVNDNDNPPNRQFFNKPTLSKLTNLNGEVVFGISIGSGFRPNLSSETTIPDRFYTIFDKQPYESKYTLDIITTNNLYDASDNLLQNEDSSYYETALSNLNSKSGWYIDLGSTFNPGEKSVNKAAVHAGVVYFSTYLPKIEGIVDICQIGSSASNAKFYSIDLKNAAAVYPANNGNTADLVTEDRSTLLESNIGIAPEINIARVVTLTESDDGTETESVNTLITPCLQCSAEIHAPDYLRGLSWEEMK